MKSIIRSSLKEAFKLIIKNKRMFLVLFMLQSIFFSLIFAVNMKFQPEIIDSYDNVLEYISSNSEKENIFGENPFIISSGSSVIARNMTIITLLSLLIFAVINGAMWFLSSSLVNKKKPKTKEFLKYLTTFSIISIAVLYLIMLFFYSAFSSLFSITYPPKTFNMIHFLLAVILFYFLWISLALAFNTLPKELFRKTLRTGYKKFFKIIISYIIISFFYLLSFIIFLISIEGNIFIMTLSVLIFFFSLIYARLFFINVIKKLS